jgi:hypothetical protein
MTTATGAAATDSRAAPQNQTTPLDKTTGDGAKPGMITQRDGVLSQRDALLSDMDARIEARRREEAKDFARQMDIDPNSVDPRAAAMVRAAELEQGRQPAAARPVEARRDAVPLPVADAAATAALQGNPDPLAQFIVVREGKPLVRLVVDGKEREVPLEQARATLQKAEAVETRFRQAAARQKELDAREAALRAREAARNSGAQPVAVAPKPAQAVDLKAEAKSLVHSLLTEDEDKAAARMQGVLEKIAARGPTIDPGAIVQEAAGVAVQKIAAQRFNEALVDGLTELNSKYPEVMADSDLSALADGKTTSLAREHPEWAPQQVMLEAARLVHDRFIAPRGQQPAQQREAIQLPRVDVSGNQQRKDGLVPMPQARSGVGSAATGEEQPADERQSMSEALADIRKGRGQTY